MKVVGIGGGHGLAATLCAARLYATEIAAVVTVADDGGSSGRLTRELGIPPPGDIRNCLVALAEDPELAELYQHRFDSGALTGHTVGNLIIAAMTEMTGDFAAAVTAAGKSLHAVGSVHPATSSLVTLRARVEDREIKGQVAVAESKSPIQAVYLDPADPPADTRAVEAIMQADQIVMGPGSLFTSLIATLLVPGIRRALQATTATRVFVCNSRRQKGETEGLAASDHIQALLAHVGPFVVDRVLLQSPEIPVDGVTIDRDALAFLGLDLTEANVSNSDGSHDAERLAAALRDLV